MDTHKNTVPSLPPALGALQRHTQEHCVFSATCTGCSTWTHMNCALCNLHWVLYMDTVLSLPPALGVLHGHTHKNTALSLPPALVALHGHTQEHCAFSANCTGCSTWTHKNTALLSATCTGCSTCSTWTHMNCALCNLHWVLYVDTHEYCALSLPPAAEQAGTNEYLQHGKGDDPWMDFLCCKFGCTHTSPATEPILITDSCKLYWPSLA